MSVDAQARTARQRLVVEIGDAGQAHVQRATGIVTTIGLSAEVEAHYLAGAGFGLVRTASHAASRAAIETNPEVVIATDADRAEPPANTLAQTLARMLHDVSAISVAQGSARALRQIRVAARVDVEPVPPLRSAP